MISDNNLYNAWMGILVYLPIIRNQTSSKQRHFYNTFFQYQFYQFIKRKRSGYRATRRFGAWINPTYNKPLEPNGIFTATARAKILLTFYKARLRTNNREKIPNSTKHRRNKNIKMSWYLVTCPCINKQKFYPVCGKSAEVFWFFKSCKCIHAYMTSP